MKSVKFLLAMFATVLILASCATTQSVSDEDFDDATTRRIGNRVYVEDPYYGTVVLERDPVTGRYYDVTYGYRGNAYSYPYNNSRNNNYRRYRGYNHSYGNYNSGSVQRPSTEQTQKTREEARKKILGQ